jgi:hypothetical protein
MGAGFWDMTASVAYLQCSAVLSCPVTGSEKTVVAVRVVSVVFCCLILQCSLIVSLFDGLASRNGSCGLFRHRCIIYGYVEDVAFVSFVLIILQCIMIRIIDISCNIQQIRPESHNVILLNILPIHRSNNYLILLEIQNINV